MSGYAAIGNTHELESPCVTVYRLSGLHPHPLQCIIDLRKNERVGVDREAPHFGALAYTIARRGEIDSEAEIIQHGGSSSSDLAPSSAQQIKHLRAGPGGCQWWSGRSRLARQVGNAMIWPSSQSTDQCLNFSIRSRSRCSLEREHHREN